MSRKLFFYLFLVGLVIGLVSPVFSLEKVRLGSSTKTVGNINLPILTAEQRGFWKENGLEVEFIPFGGAVPLMRAAAAGVLPVALSASEAPMTAAEKGVFVVMVAVTVLDFPFYLWVRTDSPYQHPRDLKGKRVGVTTLGGTMHAYGRVMFRALAMEKDVRFVGAGGVVEAAAGFRAGAFDALITGPAIVAKLRSGGIIREMASTTEYLPSPWFSTAMSARKDYARSSPDTLRKVIRATVQATNFIQKNPRWTIDMMKGLAGWSDEEAKDIFDRMKFSTTGRIDRKAVENARRFYIEYGLLTEKAPAVDELFTNEYLPGA